MSAPDVFYFYFWAAAAFYNMILLYDAILLIVFDYVHYFM